MPRRPRVEFPGALYHVTSKGNDGCLIYRQEADRELFLRLFGRVVRRRTWRCHAYCLMGTHYHFLVETPNADLGAGMQWLNGVYAQGLNRRYGRSGHLFQGRYGGTAVVRGAHFLEAARYIVLNPVRAGLCESPDEWAWSSYRATAGDLPPSSVLTTGDVLAQFGPRLETARARYRAFIADGL